MARKTFKIEPFVEQANIMLRSKNGSEEARLAIGTLVESTLMEAGAYGGFRYLGIDELVPGCKPGVRCGPNGEVLSYEERFLDTDHSRRQYFWKR